MPNYLQPALSISLTASPFISPSFDRFNVSALNFPNSFKVSDSSAPLTTGYSLFTSAYHFCDSFVTRNSSKVIAFSTFLEYNSRLFVLANSYAPFQKVPLRASLGLILSTYDDDYKLDGFSEVNWIFNISLGF